VNPFVMGLQRVSFGRIGSNRRKCSAMLKKTIFAVITKEGGKKMMTLSIRINIRGDDDVVEVAIDSLKELLEDSINDLLQFTEEEYEVKIERTITIE